MQKVLIIYTGGTIGMELTDNGSYAPTGGFEALAKRTIATAIWDKMPAHDYLEINPAIDSADMSPQHWHLIADTIITHYEDYAGFIVLHGTDTMAYTASMLSFLLGRLDKMVILTGSQIPLIEPCSDGANNLLIALQLIETANVPEVCVYFANQLFRGNRVTKISTSAMVAFESTNYPELARFENQIKLFNPRWLEPEKPLFNQVKNHDFLPVLNTGLVAVIYLTPGMPAGIMQAAISGKAQGLVIVSYGSGNVPVSNTDFLHTLKTAHQRGIVMVNVSQCLGGHVSDTYVASKPLYDAGVISGADMTIEAAVTKLYYLLCQYGNDTAVIQQQLKNNLRGELTPR